jgi:membrane protease YdiL (CAAX protease family)
LAVQNPPSGSASETPGPGPEPAGRQPRWGLGDVWIGFFAGEFLSVLFYALVLSGTSYDPDAPSGTGAAFGQVVGHLANGTPPAYHGPFPLWLTAVMQIPLWACLAGVPVLATITKGNGPVRDLGLRFRAIDVPVGLAIGVASQVVLVPLIYVPIFWIFGHQDVSAVARELTDRATSPFSVVALFVIVGIGAPIAEELFFRGLTQRSAERRFGPTVAWVGTAAFFAVTHFELLQLPALFAFGLILGWLARRTGRLGMSIFSHLGFNLMAAAALVWNIPLPG